MENQRLFLFLALGAILFLIWTSWQDDYGSHPAPQNVVEKQSTGEQPAAPPLQAETSSAEQPSQRQQQATLLQPSERIRVITDVFKIEISTTGGGIRLAKLRKYATSADNPAPYTLLSTQFKPFFIAQIGLVATKGSSPGTQAQFQAQKKVYRLAPGEQKLVVPLVWHGPNGVTVTRRYIFHRGKYVIKVEQEIHNNSDTPWSAYQYTQLIRGPYVDGGFFVQQMAYTGGAVYSPKEGYQQIPFEDMGGEPLSLTIKNGWAAITQHYFLAAWIPPRGKTALYYSDVIKAEPNHFKLGMSLPRQTIEPGGSAIFHSRLYVGPKNQQWLASIAPGLELTVDYGWLTPIARPMFTVLAWIHSVVGNWGWAIVFMTILIKLIFYKLSETSYRSMARMRKLQPRMQQIKERFGDDRQRMNQELMALYKQEKVNPLGGCLPMLIQIPVFIALYWVLLGSVELRMAPFILWIDDLSSPDPYYVLPILTGLTMVAQFRLNPSPMDPAQQKVMMLMPVVFTAVFAFFPAGLVLYYLVNNGLSILQQWVITRRMEGGETKRLNIKSAYKRISALVQGGLVKPRDR